MFLIALVRVAQSISLLLAVSFVILMCTAPPKEVKLSLTCFVTFVVSSSQVSSVPVRTYSNDISFLLIFSYMRQQGCVLHVVYPLQVF